MIKIIDCYDEIPLGKKGVYEMYDMFTGKSLYIGKAQDLRKRLYQYQSLGYGKAFDLYQKIETEHPSITIKIYGTDCPAMVESELLLQKKPKYNVRINE